MAKVETRLPCPVCVGLKMKKARLGKGKGEFVLDHCTRCGGVWFELSEVQRLRAQRQSALWQRVQRRDYEPQAQCHACHAHMSRSFNVCKACGHNNQLDCPSCQTPMQVITENGLTLDVCKKCKGIWFDHAELEAIWQIEVSSAVTRRSGVTAGAADVGGSVLLEALMWSPDLMFVGAHVAGNAVGAAGSLLSNAPDLLVSAGEIVVEAASGVFEVIVGLLEGLG